jgi:glutaryl-CoA dehydrogenase
MTRPTDLLDSDSLLTDDERAVRAAVKKMVDVHIQPRMIDAERNARFAWEIAKPIADMGLLGATLTGWGCAGMNATSYFLAMAELERADSAVRSFASVQGALVMFPIWKFGSTQQKDRWLPLLRTADAVGCFGLTEPDAGSDPASMRTLALPRAGGGYTLTGAKRWITNGTRADVAVVWAKTDRDDKSGKSVRGFIVEKGTKGFSQLAIEHKQSFRGSDTGELVFDDVVLPADSILPDSKGLGSALACLGEARSGIAVGVLGAAESCFDTALSYAKTRIAFGKPIAATQFVQQKLTNMAVALSQAWLLGIQLGRQKEQGKHTPAMVSVCKMNNVRTALDVARTCRDILGGNGITDAYPVMRHMNNLETVFTYEGTHDVHALVIGAHLTGIPAFG